MPETGGAAEERTRVVFREEHDSGHLIGVFARGDVTADSLDALAQFVDRQRRRLEARCQELQKPESK